MAEIIGGIFILSIIVMLSGLKVVKEYDRLVIFRFGRVNGTRGPGLQMIVPFIDRAQVVDTRVVTLPIPTLEERTADHVHVRVSALCMFQVADPVKATTAIDSPTKATTEGAQIIMRQVIGSHTLRHLLLHRKQLDAKLKLELEKRAKTWGVRIKSMEVKEVKLPRDVKKTIARGKREANLIEGNGHGTSDSEALNAQLSQILNIPES